MKKRNALLLLSCLAALSGFADLVHVIEQTEANGQVVQISDRSLYTGMPWATQSAPAKSGYVFTHWTISTQQDFAARDEWGRAFDSAIFMLYEDTTLTAHYLPASQDGDADGMADGYEIYWYGDLNQGPSSDTDGDGLPFAEELVLGTSPVMPESDVEGPVRYADGALLTYNPFGKPGYIFRSEPEGVLFASVGDIVNPGTYLTSESLGAYGATAAKFAYWTVNGVEQRDEWGRAIDVIAFNMPTSSVEVVAYVEENETNRRKLYWYGTTDVEMTSDTDGDGFTFAEELANGTNPLMPESDVEGPVRYADGALLQYNPYNMQPYTIRSEPEGTLFATVTEYIRPGWQVDPTVYSPTTSEFAYWIKNGTELRDEWGRAIDNAVFAMPTTAVELVAYTVVDATARQKLYWYGTTDVEMASDTDGDGFSFADELVRGTNPLMAEEDVEGPVRYADTTLHEVNLQPFEQVTGTVVDGDYQELFTSNWAGNDGTSVTFDSAVTPIVVDLDGDGRFDLVVETDKGTRRVFLNGGSVGNPQFVEVDWNPGWLAKVVAAKVTSVEGLALDTPVVNGTGYSFADVDRDGVEDLLASDAEGRVWFYKGGKESGETHYTLQNKVWGGTFGGFAEGMTIAAVDWDDDGDIDLVCGTATGKLMLLNDPRIGRPVNVQAEAGVDSVVLTWDPNVNSRVRGYGVYRSADSNNYDKVASMWPLPRYRDVPNIIQDYYYRVTGMSRFYITGNSTPIESESMPTDAIFVQFRPSVWLNDTSSFTETNVEMIVSINNSMGVLADGLAMSFGYDSNVLEPVEVKTTGLTDELELEVGVGDGNYRITAKGGEIKTGAGMFLKLVFYVKPWCGVSRTEVALNVATMKALDGRAINLDLPKVGAIEIAERRYEPAVMSVAVGSVATDTCEEFEVPVTITASETLTNFAAKVTWDDAALELRGDATVSFDGTVPESFVLKFYAKDQHTISATEVSLSEIAAVDCHGNAITANAATGTVLITDAHPLVPAVVSISTEDKKVDTLEEVTISFRVNSTEKLKSGSFTLAWDDDVLEFVQAEGAIRNGNVFTGTGDFSATFLAKDQHEVTKTEVSVTAASVTDVNDFIIAPSVPVVANVLIHDAHPLVPAKVTMTLADVAAKTETDFEMTLAIATTEALTSLDMDIAYDTSLLTYLSGQLKFTDGVPSSVIYRFHAKENHTVDKTTVTITPKSGVDHNGLTAELPASVVGNVVLADSNPWQPATVALSMQGSSIDTMTEFKVPVKVTSNEKLTNFVATVGYDAAVLELRGVEGAAREGASSTVKGAGGDFVLKFYAKDQHDVFKTTVSLTGASAVDEHGLVANAIADASADIVIHDSNPPIPAEVAVKMGSASAKTRSEFSVAATVTSTKALANLGFSAAWNADALELKGVIGATIVSSSVNSCTVASATNPKEVIFTFLAKEQHTIAQTEIALIGGSATCTEGLAANVSLSGGTVLLTDSNPPVAPTMAMSALDVKAESGKQFVVNVGSESVGELSQIVMTLEWDASLLTFVGVEEDAAMEIVSANSRRFTLSASGIDNRYHFKFTAAFISALQATSWAKVTTVSATGANGLAAQLKTALPLKSNILIVREVNKYDPGDIDGDGKYTDADLDRLNKYIAYLNVVKTGNKQAIAAVQKYNLTGLALKAADVNRDGKIDANDISMLAQYIAAAKEVAE